MSFTPSPYQQAIFDWAATGKVVVDGETVESKSIIVNAVAGSGKTTTAVKAIGYLTGKTIFLAFNKHIEVELQSRLGNAAQAKTIHSLGNAAVRSWLRRLQRSPKIEQYKYSDICKDLIQDLPKRLNREQQIILSTFAQKLVGLCQATLADPADGQALWGIIDHYQVDDSGLDFISFSDLQKLVQTVIDKGIEEAKYGIIDFSDMVYLPVALDLEVEEFDNVILDECQDLNACQLELVSKALRHNGRLMAIGDPRQSIYGFSGADHRSFWQVKERFNCAELPLSVCYRCPSKAIELAKSIVPAITARDGAPDGVLGELTLDQALKELASGDYVISRKVAPLISMCIQLIAQRKKASVLGRDIASGLTSLVKKVEKLPGFDYSDFSAHLESYVNSQIQVLMKKSHQETKIERLNDQMNGILAVYENVPTTSAKALCAEIESLFDDKGGAGIKLCSVHKSKGLESDRIFIFEPEAMPLVWKGQLPWQLEQEINLKYVALTRPKRELYFIPNKDSGF